MLIKVKEIVRNVMLKINLFIIVMLKVIKIFILIVIISKIINKLINKNKTIKTNNYNNNPIINNYKNPDKRHHINALIYLYPPHLHQS